MIEAWVPTPRAAGTAVSQTLGLEASSWDWLLQRSQLTIQAATGDRPPAQVPGSSFARIQHWTYNELDHHNSEVRQ